MHTSSGIRVGFQVWGQNVPWHDLMAEAAAIEARGFASLWSNDHLLPAAGPAASAGGLAGGVFEGWMTLAGFAAATSTIPLGVLVSGAGYRNPGLLVKQATALDHLSGGRVSLGLGAGWHEREHRAFGFSYPSLGDRISRMAEQAEVIRGLLDGGRVTHHGQWVDMDDATNEPRPVGSLPLLIGGSGERRTLAVVARHADAWNGEGDPPTWHRKNGILDAHCAAIGRDPAAIVRTVGVPPACIRESRADAVAVLTTTLERHGLTAAEAGAAAGESLLVGTDADIVEALDAWGAAGAVEAIVDWPPPFDRTTLDRLAALAA